MDLPVESIRDQALAALDAGPVVIHAPTGTGKSTQVPRWCAGTFDGKVLVVEPRRVACRSLAQRVAELEGAPLGRRVGYSVRDDHKASEQTKILYATTGVVVRMIAEAGMSSVTTVILDEFHERSLDIDLLFALFAARKDSFRLVVMSATLEAERVAEHLKGSLLRAQSRLFPVDISYLPPPKGHLPEVQGLSERIKDAIRVTSQTAGDVLVFLPGKGEIFGVAQALAGEKGLEVFPLHGGLTLKEQHRAFEPPRAGYRKVVLATNVAETSVTLPGVSVVIDSGLVRRTRYHQGRGYLTLAPIAMDSAEQRAGRAGRTGPGRCLRLWSDAALLEKRTPPEIHREALSPLILAAAACHEDVRALPLLDQPRDYAVESALEDLVALGALSAHGRITSRGKQLFGLPVDAPLGRFLVEAQRRGTLADAIDLVAVLSVGRPLFSGPLKPDDDEHDDPRACGCDATARILALRGAKARRGLLSGFVLAEARGLARRLRGAFGLEPKSAPSNKVDGDRLARTAIAADPRVAHVARSRRGKVAFGNGGTELDLARESALKTEGKDRAEAIVVFESRALGKGPHGTKVLITCAMPVAPRVLVEAELGAERVRDPKIKKGTVVATIERVFAKKVLDVREEVPQGKNAEQAIAALFLRGSLFPEALEETKERLEAWHLLARLEKRSQRQGGESLEDWVTARVKALGVESGADLALLSAEVFLADQLPAEKKQWLDSSYPRQVKAADTTYRVCYNLAENEVILEPKRQSRKRAPLPPASYLPPFRGFRVVVRDKGVTRVVREL